MRNWIQDGIALDLVAAAVIVSGQCVKTGSIISVAAKDAAIGETYAGYVQGVYSLPKATGAWSVGDLLYWDDTAKVVTKTSTSNTKMGYAVAAALSGDATGVVRLVPTL